MSLAAFPSVKANAILGSEISFSGETLQKNKFSCCFSYTIDNVSGKTKIVIVSPGFSLGQYSNFQNEREKIKKLIELSKPLDTNKTIYI